MENSDIRIPGEGPAPVHKLGHFGMCVTDFAKAFDFYTTRFNFKPSEVSTDPDHDSRCVP